MTEAYLFACQLLPAGENFLAALCRTTGLRPERIEALYRIAPTGPQPVMDLPVLDWPAAPLLDHFVLQHLCAELIAGRLELAGLSQANGEQNAALLLGGPAAVGRYNLLPLARLQPLDVLAGGADFMARAAAQVEGLLPEGERITHLAGDLTADALPLFNAGQVLSEGRGAIFQLQALSAARAAWSLLVSQTAGAGLITLVEKI